jgi:hypothetical protein
MANLSDTQTVLLSVAAARADRSVLPAPEGLKVRGAALRRSLKSLLRRGLVVETAAQDAACAWKRTEEHDGHPAVGLIISPAGLAAIGINATAHSASEEVIVRGPDPRPEPAAPVVDLPLAPPRPGGKLGTVVDAIARPTGASLDELVALSGWLPHTTRAAVTRLRQRGHDVTLRTVDGRKAYCLTRPA